MRRMILTLLLLGGCAAAAPYRPLAIRTEGVPPVPDDLAERLARYEEVRGTVFRGWGPGGTMLVARRAGSVTQLHLVRSPGAPLEQLTSGDDPARAGVLVPPSGDLVFSRGSGGDERYQIFRREAATGTVTRLTDGKGRCIQGPLNRTGDTIAYLSNRENGTSMDVYLLDLQSGRSTPLTRGIRSYRILSDWSPDGTWLATVSYTSANDSILCLMNLKTGEEHIRDPLLPHPRSVMTPRFAERSNGFYFTSDEKGEFKRLAYMNLDTGAVRWHAELPWDVVDIEVRGDRVAFLTNEDGQSRLSVMEDGIVSRPDLPTGSVSGMEFSPDGKRLGFTLGRPDAPSDAYAWDFEEGRLIRWTTSGTGGIDPATFVAPERIRVPTFDGRKIPAYVYRPRGVARPPVVLYLHGGPESQYRPRFSSTFQFWLNDLKVAIVAPNVRGSAGYGKTYVALDNGMKREDSVKDVGAVLDWIGAQPDLDGSRVAVYGGSYGGYLVLASLVRYGDRIRAGIDVVGIANFVTFLERTSRYRVDLRRVEYGDERDPAMRAFLERISPANHADRIRSALLVAHGRNDPRVPLFETELIARRVRARGRPAWTVVAENEGHGFARKENRAYLGAVMFLFLRDHLKD